ncbi:protein ImuB [Allosphingosinicella indica]|uniref:Protein ImuB n=2 Tax=Allosphingosinicella indica TaxID=941907 RepID=A0A1X7FYE0_9SPHN|nr:protein ImuB [Allosphingosinicella indica]
MREMGRRSEHAGHPFRTSPSSKGGGRFPIPVTAAGCGRPTIIVRRSGQRDIITAACPAALALGIAPGMAAAHARALVSGLDVREAAPEADKKLLDRLALHAAQHWTPIASVSGMDGLWLDLAGTTHLFGGEARFCRRVIAFLARLGFTARIAIAGTPGAAHALARHGEADVIRIAPGAEGRAIFDLPLAALRLTPDALDAAARFGIDRIGDLYAMPRGPLARRLGLAAIERLDQARGDVAEPITPLVPPDTPQVRRRLVEPIGTAESIAKVVEDLAADLVALMRERGRGVRLVVLAANRVDGERLHLAIGASRPTRDARHLVRMFTLKLPELDPGLGIEAVTLTVIRDEPLAAEAAGTLIAGGSRRADLAPLVDRLATRAGPESLFRVTSVESDVPERAVQCTPPLVAPHGWPQWKRPVRMLRRPEPLFNVVALMPDHPPRRFTWRARSFRVIAGDGPERVHGEWWRNDREMWAVRDYFRVESEQGARFWLFRRGDGVTAASGDLSWYLHGLFG